MKLSTFLHEYFGSFSRILSTVVRLVFLLVAFFCLKFAMEAFIEYDMSEEDLIAHTGVLETIEPLEYWEKHNDKPVEMHECKLRLQNDSSEYFTGQTINYLTENLNIGDTITVYTKEKIPGLSNLRSHSNSVSSGAQANEIYHLVKNGNDVIDFQKHRKALIPVIIIMPILAFIFFIWFWGRLPFNWRFSSS